MLIGTIIVTTFFAILYTIFAIKLRNSRRKRIIKITYESGDVKYRCEHKGLIGWKTMTYYVIVGGIKHKAIFSTLDAAKRFITRDTIKSEKEVEI